MRFFKEFILFFLFKILNFLFIFWKLDISNSRKIDTFKYLQKIDEIIYLQSNTYFVYNNKKSFNFLKFKELKINKYYYCYLVNAFAVSTGDYPIFLNNQFKVIMESLNLNIKYINSSIFIKSFCKLLFFRPKIKKNDVICFSGSLNDNKFHWLMDYLPRLEYVVENNIQNNYTYIVNKNNINFIKFYLNVLGVNNKNILQWDGLNLEIKNLHIFSTRYIKYNQNKSQVYSSKSILWLSSYLKKKYNHVNTNLTYNKIIVLRKKNDFRRIINQDELINFLSKYDYKCLYLEDYKEEKIIEIFKSANTVIAVHGAALSNIIFSNEIKVIEIFPATRPDDDEFVYFQLTRTLNFDHHVFVIDKKNCSKGIYINLKLFKKTLENIL